MYSAKKGDFIVSKVEAWEITDVNSGICLCILRMVKRESALKIGTHAPFSRSHIRHKLASGEFFIVPKAKKSTVQILFT